MSEIFQTPPLIWAWTYFMQNFKRIPNLAFILTSEAAFQSTRVVSKTAKIRLLEFILASKHQLWYGRGHILCRSSRWFQIWPPFWPQRLHFRAQEQFPNWGSNETILSFWGFYNFFFFNSFLFSNATILKLYLEIILVLN